MLPTIINLPRSIDLIVHWMVEKLPNLRWSPAAHIWFVLFILEAQPKRFAYVENGYIYRVNTNSQDKQLHRFAQFISLARSVYIYTNTRIHSDTQRALILWSGVGLRKAKLGFWVWYKKLFVAMVERRKPLVLSSTKLLINSVLTSSSSPPPPPPPPPQLADRVEDDVSSGTLQLRAGILRFPRDKIVISSYHSNLASLDDAALVGLSTCALKRLSITSASMVIKNISISSIKLGLVVEKIKEKETI